jgi:hypothetical protein
MNYRDIKRFFTSWIAVFVLALIISAGCNKDNNNNVNFTIDLTQPQFSILQNNFGVSVWYNGVCIARDASGNYVAVSGYCTVDNSAISFSGSTSYFICASYGHTFNEAGVETNAPGAASLVSYHTQLINNLLRIYQ